MVNAVVEAGGEPTLEGRKAHSRHRGQLGDAPRPFVIVADEDAEVVLRQNHRLKETGLLGRRIKHLDEHEQLGGLHFVVSLAIGHPVHQEERGEQLFDHRMQREHRHLHRRDRRSGKRSFPENILLAELHVVQQRQHDDARSAVLRRHLTDRIALQADTLLRGHEARRLFRLFQHQRSRQDEQHVHLAVGRKTDALSGIELDAGKAAIGGVADATERSGKGRTPTTIRSATLSQCRLLKLRFGLIIHK